MLGSIFKTLDMNYENGLTDSISKSKSVYQEQIYKMVNEKLGVDAIYFLRNAIITSNGIFIIYNYQYKKEEVTI